MICSLIRKCVLFYVNILYFLIKTFVEYLNRAPFSYKFLITFCALFPSFWLSLCLPFAASALIMTGDNT